VLKLAEVAFGCAGDLSVGPVSGSPGAEFWVLGIVGSCLIKAKATSLAADLMIATGALPLFLKIDMAGGFNPNSHL
jgi:hypothetical protein